jgi:hypothetical protein
MSVDLADRQCTAKSKTSGNRCRRYAIPGGNVCAVHGGSAGHVRAAAARRLARVELEGQLGDLLPELERQAAELGPTELLLMAVSRTAGMVATLGLMVDHLSGTVASTGPEVAGAVVGVNGRGEGATHALVTELGRWTDRLGRISRLSIEAGVDECRVRISEQQGEQMASIVTAARDQLFGELIAAGVDPVLLESLRRERWGPIVRTAVEATSRPQLADRTSAGGRLSPA